MDLGKGMWWKNKNFCLLYLISCVFEMDIIEFMVIIGFYFIFWNIEEIKVIDGLVLLLIDSNIIFIFFFKDLVKFYVF